MVKRRRARCSYKDCGKNYYNIYNLKRHAELKHLGHQKYICSLCQKRLASKQNLDEHTSTHSLDKPYNCPVSGCNQAFRQASLLSVHKKMHQMLSEQVLENVMGNQGFQSFSTAKMEDLYKELAHVSMKSDWKPPFLVLPQINFERHLRNNN